MKVKIRSKNKRRELKRKGWNKWGRNKSYKNIKGYERRIKRKEVRIEVRVRSSRNRR